ncbi:Olfactory receptor 7G1 [Sciurus carolinensis]|uniref:Olfactory receptor 7G1 n=1 Tax=Sciurus carolinensis TaxID=30640 RepID=A0AA41MSR0_SCICA|nr:Olfactory receptor 7G1 [Sciurus carolinensis]
MEAGNHTDVSEFLLLGLTEDPELQPLIFRLFLSMYLVTILGNLLIILAVSSDPHLHTPMYIFLSNLSFTDICISTTTIPKMLANIQAQDQSITYTGCLSQFFCELAQVLKLACSDTLINIILVHFLFTILGASSVSAIIFSYTRIVCSLLRIPSTGKKYKAFSTCGSHLLVVSLFYGTGFGVYISSVLTDSPGNSAVASVMYTVVPQMLNPFIYSLRNRDMKEALRKIINRRKIC